MLVPHLLKDLRRDLKRDTCGDSNPFSEDVATANKVLLHPHATDAERTEALSLWLQRNQPCLFGRIAAATDNLHFCFITDDELQGSEQDVVDKIHRSLVDWKRRSLQPIGGVFQPAHGFVLAIVSHWVATASPDENLFRLACRIRDLWGCVSSTERSGTIHWETLFLQNPQDHGYVRFTFGVDFFSAQGDGRWWHDHRVPCGLLFTANSVGHMRRYREWYKGSKDQKEWILKTAMETIYLAAETPYGKSTWLKPLVGGQPIVTGATCPFAYPEKIKKELVGMDWTRYGGHLHTDHSIRKEFFSPAPGKSKELAANEWLEDFAYLYNPGEKDHIRFVAGEPVPFDEIVAELEGEPKDWERFIYAKVKDVHEPSKVHPEVGTALEECRQWRLPPDQLRLYGD